jgi:hypothetical protein
MSWASLANNRTVSFNNLQNAVNNGVFTAKTSIPASNEQITKADANTYVNINTSYSPYAAKASNQLVVKSDLQAVITSYAHTIFYDYECFYDGYTQAGASTAAGACALTSLSITLYSADFALGNGSRLYYNSNLSAASEFLSDAYCTGVTPGFYRVGDYSFKYSLQNTSGITNYTLCPGQTAYAITGCGVSNSSASGACSDAQTNPKTLYSECETLSVGCSLFYNSSLTSPVTELYVFAQASWDMDSTGIIQNFSSIQC